MTPWELEVLKEFRGGRGGTEVTFEAVSISNVLPHFPVINDRSLRDRSLNNVCNMLGKVGGSGCRMWILRLCLL